MKGVIAATAVLLAALARWPRRPRPATQGNWPAVARITDATTTVRQPVAWPAQLERSRPRGDQRNWNEQSQWLAVIDNDWGARNRLEQT
jgi:hypothetical protein